MSQPVSSTPPARRFSFAALRVRLLLLVLIAVIPAWGLMLYSAGEQRRIATEVVQQDALRLARIVAASQDGFIEGARQILTALAELPEIRNGDMPACNRLFAGLVEKFPSYVAFGVIAPDGTVPCSALPLPTPLNLADRAYFRGAIEGRDFAIGEYQIGRITRKASVNFGYPVIDEAGVVRAVVFAALDLAWLNELAAATELPEGAVLSLIDRNGVILVRYPNPEAWVGKALSEAPLVKAIEARGGEGVAEVIGEDGVPRLYGFTSLPGTPNRSVFLSIGVPKASVFAQVERVFQNSLIGLAVVALLALAAAWIGGYAFILRQLHALIEATGRVAAGDLGARTGMRGDGELNRLAAAFDDMAAALQRRESEAKRSAEEIALLQSMTLAIGAAEDLHAALAIALKMICETSGWILGQAWTPESEGRELRCSPGWHASVGGLEAFREASERMRFAPEVGLPGRAWSWKAAVWVEDVTQDANFPRAPFAKAVGIRAGLAVPVLTGDDVVAVIEFFMLERRAQDERFARLVEALASQVGAVIQRKLAEDRVRHLAYFDALTDLPNRARLQQRLAEALADARRTNEPVALLVLALERFREINYTLGKADGDRLLRQIGPRIRLALREADLLAYFGGQRFAALLPGVGARAATDTALHIHERLEEPFEVAGLTLEIGANIGIAVFPGHGDDEAVLTRHAEVALYKAQREGRSLFLYDAKQDFYNPRRLQLMGELRSAIGDRQMTLYCQPKLDLRTYEIVAMETLVRWQHPSYGLVSPDQFVPLVESTGLIGPLTQWILEAALLHCHTWQQDGTRVPAAVNLSARNLADPRLIDYIHSALATWGAEVDWLDLEITESAIMADPQAALETLARLDAMGFRLFIDDFGTGYSSLAYLQKLPIDAIKIDKSFVLPMIEDRDAALIVRSTIELGHNLGLKVIAEGVESREICEALVAMGCDEAQGYYVSPPIPTDEFTAWLATAPWPIKATKGQ